jgi:hypothetical protein
LPLSAACRELEVPFEYSGLSYVLRITNLIRKAQCATPLSNSLLQPPILALCCSDLEALVEQSGLSHVLRVTNLIRKAHCVLAKPNAAAFHLNSGTPCSLASCCSELEALIEQSGLCHVLRVTILICKAHCATPHAAASHHTSCNRLFLRCVAASWKH